MIDLEAWILTIISRPHDRCIFADYLEDHGFYLAAMGERWLGNKAPNRYLGWFCIDVPVLHEKAKLPNWMGELNIPLYVVKNSYGISLNNCMNAFEAEMAILWLFEQMEFQDGQPVQYASNGSECNRLFDPGNRTQPNQDSRDFAVASNNFD